MTWSINAGGHHNKNYADWEEDEYTLLSNFIAAIDASSDENTVTSTFVFNGNHVQVKNLDEAREKVREHYDTD